jgi:hypothetical protein
MPAATDAAATYAISSGLRSDDLREELAAGLSVLLPVKP